MGNFFIGVLASLLAAALLAAIRGWLWPKFSYRFISKGIRIVGIWAIIENRNSSEVVVGQIELKQTGYIVTGTSTRRITREGKESYRQFQYRGKILNNQLTLTFEDKKGDGFDSGTYVFVILNDGHTMEGQATFHGKKENKIISEPRRLEKKPS